MMQCSCEINGLGGDDSYEEVEEKILTHNTSSVVIKCGECGREINLGEQFEWCHGQYDEYTCVHHTCMDCLSLRQYFFGDWTFERLWEDFNQHMDDCDWEVPEDCLSKVTPAVRSEIGEMIEQEWSKIEDETDLATDMDADASKPPECEQCGCTGNESCGHEPVDKEWLCALRPDMRCSCCHAKDAEGE